jgi:hypothetical protein
MSFARSCRGISLVAVAAVLAAAPSLGRAQRADGRLANMEDRITALEDQLRASQEVIKAQQEQLKAVAPASVGANGGGGLDPFLQSIQIGGHLAASYGYNFANPKGNNFTNTLCQFNCNHNEFSLDAAKLEIGKAAAEPGSLGFQFDLLYGQNAAILRNLAPGPDREGTPQDVRVASDAEVFLQNAFVTYNLNGVELKAGKFETLLGYEVLDSDGNANVTHGSLFTFAIPAFHTGFLVSGSMGEGGAWAAGIVNGFNNTRDAGDSKGFLGKLAWTAGPLFAQVTSYVGTLGEMRPSLSNGGALVGDNSTTTKVFDTILQYQPTESLKFWVNADIGRTQVRGLSNDPQWFGAALGTKMQLTNKLYLALRGEYMNDDGGSRLGFLDLTGSDKNEIDLYTATLTLGYQVTPNLQARLEFRHDFLDCDDQDCDFFFDRDAVVAGGKDTNDLALLELVYSFE